MSARKPVTFDDGREVAHRMFCDLHKLSESGDFAAIEELAYDAYCGDPAADTAEHFVIYRRGLQNNVVHTKVQELLDAPEALRGFLACLSDYIMWEYVGMSVNGHTLYGAQPVRPDTIPERMLRMVDERDAA